MKHIAVIFAGGIGSRMGSDTPKQFLTWDGKAILIHTLEVFEQHPQIDGIVLACKEEWMDYSGRLIAEAGLKKVLSIVPGGATALDSQYNGLREVKRICPGEDVIVLIHDGVRPLVDLETISRNILSAEEFGSAITVTNAIETVICVNEAGDLTDVLERSTCRMAKAPQTFLLSQILAVHEKAISEGRHTFIDSATMMYTYGYSLHTVMGTPENIKVTTPSDFYMFLGISKSRKEEGSE